MPCSAQPPAIPGPPPRNLPLPRRAGQGGGMEQDAAPARTCFSDAVLLTRWEGGNGCDFFLGEGGMWLIRLLPVVCGAPKAPVGGEMGKSIEEATVFDLWTTRCIPKPPAHHSSQPAGQLHRLGHSADALLHGGAPIPLLSTAQAPVQARPDLSTAGRAGCVPTKPIGGRKWHHVTPRTQNRLALRNRNSSATGRRPTKHP